jgi:drug/metabolite transporter (DMT)-like permease
VISVLLALASSVTWGVSDFLGGLNSRRLPVPVVLLVSQSVGALLLLPLAALHGPPALDAARLAYAATASVSGLIGIAGLYRGMSVGSISIVAPISGTGAVIPVVFGLAHGEEVSPVQAAGVVLALVGVVLASRAADDPRLPPRRAKLASGVGYALLAALGFGGFFVLLHEASATSDVLWAGAIQRLTGVGITLAIVLVRRRPLHLARDRLPSLGLIGVLDTTANVLYGYASVSGLVSLAAMLASLFPVVTVLLARIVLGERMSRTQGTGVLFALTGVACIAIQ